MDLTTKIQEFFTSGPGLLSAKMLRNGACIKMTIDNNNFLIEKAEGNIQVKPKVNVKTDLTWDMNKKAFDYVFSSKSWKQVMLRVKEVSFFPNDEMHAKLRVTMSDDEIADYSWRGYHYWARRMGFGL